MKALPSIVFRKERFDIHMSDTFSSRCPASRYMGTHSTIQIAIKIFCSRLLPPNTAKLNKNNPKRIGMLFAQWRIMRNTI